MENKSVLNEYSHLIVKKSDKIKEAPRVFSVTIKGKVYTFSTSGNITVVAGKQKSKKSYLTSSLAAAAVSSKNQFYLFNYHSEGLVLWFDTEQSKYHVDRINRRILWCGDRYKDEGYNGLIVFALKSEPPKKRWEIIKSVCEKLDNVGLIIIDGIRDLILDPNSPEESNDIVTSVANLAEKKQAHVVCVLHYNKGHDKVLRGHLGTEIQNKAETVISVEKVDGKKSKVAAEDCRNEEFPPFEIVIDKNGLPKLLDNQMEEMKSKNKNDCANF